MKKFSLEGLRKRDKTKMFGKISELQRAFCHSKEGKVSPWQTIYQLFGGCFGIEASTKVLTGKGQYTAVKTSSQGYTLLKKVEIYPSLRPGFHIIVSMFPYHRKVPALQRRCIGDGSQVDTF